MKLFSPQQLSSVYTVGTRGFSCTSCGGTQGCSTPNMEPYGKNKKNILIVGSMPDRPSDVKGLPWQGATGQLLKTELSRLGVSLFDDCLSTYAIRCFSDGELSLKEKTSRINCCRQKLLDVMREVRPHTVLLMGEEAVTSLIGHRWRRDFGSIDKWRGWVIPDQDFKAFLVPLFDPFEVRQADAREVYTVFRNDLEQGINVSDYTFPENKEPVIEMIEDLSPLHNIYDTVSAIDIETTGIKPYADGHRIVSVAVTTTPDHTYVFMLPNTRLERMPLITYLNNSSVKKVAHNFKFEDTWFRQRLRVETVGWAEDTMLAAHVLDNRPGINSLKFQTYVNFGIIDYESEVDSYLKSTDKKNTNAINNIMELVKSYNGVKLLLKYNGLDAIYTHRLYLRQSGIRLPF